MCEWTTHNIDWWICNKHKRAVRQASTILQKWNSNNSARLFLIAASCPFYLDKLETLLWQWVECWTPIYLTVLFNQYWLNSTTFLTVLIFKQYWFISSTTYFSCKSFLAILEWDNHFCYRYTIRLFKSFSLLQNKLIKTVFREFSNLIKQYC